jgi:hypothetical protein
MYSSRHMIIDEPFSRCARWSVRLGIFSMPVMAISLLILRGGYIEYRHAAAAFLCASALAGMGLCLGSVALARIWITGSRGTKAAIAGVSSSFLVLWIPLWVLTQWTALPRLHDVSTDLGDPPAFVVASAERRPFDNSVVGFDMGNSLAQLAAFPQIQPLYTSLDAAEATLLAFEVVQARKWRLLDASKSLPNKQVQESRIEATARAGALGMRSDITIRIREAKGGSRLDIRSSSRQGSHDLGSNADLVSRFLQDFQEAAK